MAAIVTTVVNGFDVGLSIDIFVSTVSELTKTVEFEIGKLARDFNQALCVGWYAHDVKSKGKLPADATELQKQVRDVKVTFYAKLKEAKYSNPSVLWGRVKKAAMPEGAEDAEGAEGEGEGEGEGGTAASDKPLDVQVVKMLESLIRKIDNFEGTPSIAAFKARAAAITTLQDGFNITWTEGSK